MLVVAASALDAVDASVVLAADVESAAPVVDSRVVVVEAEFVSVPVVLVLAVVVSVGVCLSVCKCVCMICCVGVDVVYTCCVCASVWLVMINGR